MKPLPPLCTLARALIFALAAFCSLLHASAQPEQAVQPETPQTDELTDADLRQRIAAKLAGVTELRDVSVSVDGGVATLSGEVADRDARSLARGIAQAQAGISEVRNELVLGGAVATRVGNAFDRSLLKLRALIGYLPLFVAAIIVVGLFGLMARWLATSALANRLVGENRLLAEMARHGIRLGIIMVGLLIALDLLDATALVGAVFGAAGLAGLAIGFAFKDLIENYVASVLMSIRQPFRPNDHVVIDGHEGMVATVNTRSTILMTLDGNHLRLPNAVVFKSVILNYTRNSERRFDFSVGVGVNEDLALAQKIGVATLQAMKGVLPEPAPMALVTDLADSSVTIQFLGWVDQNAASFGKVKGEAIRLVKLALEAEGMDLPEPIYRVKLIDVDDATPALEQAARSEPISSVSSEQRDVSIERHLDRQIAEEKVRSKQRDLLDPSAPIE